MSLRLDKFFALAAIIGLVLLNSSCSAMMRSIAKEATPAVVSGVVAGVSDPNTQRQLVAAIDEERMTALSARLSAGVVDGLLDTLEDPTRRKRLEVIVRDLTATAAVSVVDSLLSRALDARTQLLVGRLLADLMSVIVDTVDTKTGQSAGRSEALSAAAHEIGKQATLGFQEALDETRRQRESGEMAKSDGALILAASSASLTGSRILWTLGIGLGALAAGLAITLIWAIRKNRLRRSELQQRDDALLLLTEAIQATAADPGTDELHKVLKTAIRERPGGAHINKVLGKQGRHILGMDLDE